MATYNELVGVGDDTTADDYVKGMIRDWANREPDVLPVARTQEAARWAADRAYRKLRVPPLELTRTYTITEDDDIIEDPRGNGGNVFRLPIPEDLIEVIYLADTEGGVVYNEKVDTRTFKDARAETKEFYHYTRIGNYFELHGRFNNSSEREMQIDIHYYRRLPALNSVYVVTAANFNGQGELGEILTLDTGSATRTATADDLDVHVTGVLWFPSTVTTPTINDTAMDAPTTVGDRGFTFTGEQSDHWLRQENERILLFGALSEVFKRLQEPSEVAMYEQLFLEEIEELNKEERMRRCLGGNPTISFNGCGLI